MNPAVQNIIDLVDCLPIPAFVLSVDRHQTIRFQKLNRTHEITTGMSTEAIRGKTPHEALPARFAETVLANYRKCSSSGSVYEYEELLSLPTGEIWWDTTLSPIEDDGNVVGILGIASNKTASKRLEHNLGSALNAANQMNKVQQILLSTIAHDVRGPLRQSKLIFEMIMDGFQDYGDGKIQLLNIGREVVHKALGLIDEKLNETRTASAHSPQFSRIDFRHWCRDIVAILDPLGNKRFAFPEIELECEKFILDIGLRNLLENAFSFANSLVSIDVQQFDDHLVFTVADDGSGFDEKLFKGGQRPPTDRLEEKSLGLSSTTDLIEARYGRIWIGESSSSNGGVISFSIAGAIL